MSEAGIAVAIKDWSERQEAAKARVAENDKIERELGEAAYTTPIDVNRLDRAAQARNAYQAWLLADSTRRNVETLRKLSPDDRAIYARRFAIYRSLVPVQTCAANAR
jgi:hypothetical protein